MKWRCDSSSSPESKTCTMLGCCSRAAASASRRKRATKSTSSARCSASSFTATWRSSTESMARNTVDIPPAPRRRSTLVAPDDLGGGGHQPSLRASARRRPDLVGWDPVSGAAPPPFSPSLLLRLLRRGLLGGGLGASVSSGVVPPAPSPWGRCGLGLGFGLGSVDSPSSRRPRQLLQPGEASSTVWRTSGSTSSGRLPTTRRPRGASRSGCRRKRPRCRCPRPRGSAARSRPGAAPARRRWRPAGPCPRARPSRRTRR